MHGTELLHHFDAWERRTRGVDWSTDRVPLEPAYRPLLAERRVRVGVVDDARKPGLFERLLGRGTKQLSSRSVEDEQSGEEKPVESRTLTELQLLVPKEFNSRAEFAKRCLMSLASLGDPLSFEIVGQHRQTAVQIACDVSCRPRVLDGLRAFFPDVRVRDRPNGLLDAWAAADGWASVVHLGLTDRVFMSLGTDDRSDSDPLIDVIGRLASLAEGEFGLVQVLFQPTRGDWARDLLDFARNIDDVDHVLKNIDEKFREPLFACVIRVAAIAPDADRAGALVRSVGASIVTATRSAQNQLGIVEAGQHSLDDELLDVVDRESRRAGSLLSLSELATLAHLPSAAVRSESLLRQSTRTRAAPAIPGETSCVLGINEHEGDEKPVGLSLEGRLRHTYCIGASGTGKSTLLLSMADQDIAAGRGFAVLDPHGDLIEDIIARIPPERADDVVLFDPSDETHPIGFNVLSAHSELERTLLASDLVGVFRRFSTTFGDQMASILGNAILAFLESDEGGTLIDLRDFLLDKGYRADFLETVKDPEVLSYWEREFPLLKGIPQASILTRLNAFFRPKPIRYMVAQKRDNLDLRRIMDTRKILLAKLSHGAIGEENAYLLGSLLVARISQAAMSRQDEDASKRVPFFLYMDEFQHFVTPSIASILTGARKYGLGLVLSHQEIRQLKTRSDEVFSAVLGNAYTRIVFRVGEQDAKTLADGFTHFSPTDLQNLGLGEAIVRLERPDFDFNLRTTVPKPVDATVAKERKAVVLKASRAKYSTPREQIDEALHQQQARFGEPDKKDGERRDGRARSRTQQVQTPQKQTATDARDLREESSIRTATRPGRGGMRHKYLQEMVGKLGEERGYNSLREQTVLGGHGHVDVLLERNGIRIGCEISVSTSVEHEVGNITKCLAAGFDHAVLISERQDLLEAALAQFETIDRRAHFLLPEAFISFLDELDSALASLEEKDRKKPRVKKETKATSREGLAGKKMLSTEQAAEYLGISKQTLANWRVAGKGPPFSPYGRSIFYEREVLDAWIEENRRNSTSDPGPDSRDD